MVTGKGTIMVDKIARKITFFSPEIEFGKDISDVSAGDDYHRRDGHGNIRAVEEIPQEIHLVENLVVMGQGYTGRYPNRRIGDHL